MIIYDGDVLLYQSLDGGEINYINGQPEMTGGFETAAYLSLFGGNKNDDGSKDNSFTWWGNVDEEDPDKRYISRTQYILQGLPATVGNLRRLEEAVRLDLNWFLTSKIASSVEVEAVIPDINKVNISVTIKAEGKESQFNFTENWRAFNSQSNNTME